jgi:hypothetical protein
MHDINILRCQLNLSLYPHCKGTVTLAPIQWKGRRDLQVNCMGYIYRVFQKDLNDKSTFPWGIPHYHWSNMAYITFEQISSLFGACQINSYHFLNETLPHWWIGRAVNNDQHLLLWPPRSPDLTPCDFFLWGYVNQHSPKMCENCKTAFKLWCKPLMGTCWSTSGRS